MGSDRSLVVPNAHEQRQQLQVADQESLALIRDLEDQAPIDLKVGAAISSLWKGEPRVRAKSQSCSLEQEPE